MSFAGASIFNVAGGVPFLPLQTLWVNFTVQISQAIGLGYGKPAAGLMERRPREPDQPILTRSLMIWFAAIGVIMAGGTLGVISLDTFADKNSTCGNGSSVSVRHCRSSSPPRSGKPSQVAIRPPGSGEEGQRYGNQR